VVRIVPKDTIRLQVWEEGALEPREVEIRVVPVERGWESRFFWERAPLPRRFRSTSRSVALGKMLVWVRRKYPRVRPLANSRPEGKTSAEEEIWKP